MLKKVDIFVFNNLVYDSRVLRTATFLSEYYKVRVICLRDFSISQDFDSYPFEVIPLPLRSSRLGRGLALNLVKYFEFVIRLIMVSRRTDIIPANDLDSLIPAAVLKVLFRKKVVYDSHEWQSEQGDFSSKKQAFIRTIERIFLPFADQRITVSDSIAKLYMEVYGGSTFSVVRNLPEIGPIEYLEKISDKGAIQKREFLFAGMLGEGRDLINIITTFLKLGDKYALTIVGYGSMASELESMIPDKSNVTLLPAIPPDELVRFVSQFDFGIVGGEHGICASFDFSLPNKLFTYLGARLPVVGANLKEMGGLITKHGIGVTYDPRTPGSLENSIRELVALDYNDLTVAVDNLNKNLCWEQESLVLKSTYDEIYLSTKKEG